MFHAACLVALKDQPRRWDEAREKLRTTELQSDGSDTLDNWEFITQTRSMFDHALGLSDQPVCEAQRNRLIGMVSALEHECRHGHGMFSGSLEVDVPVPTGGWARPDGEFCVGIETFYAGQMGDVGRFVEIVWELEKVLVPGDNGDYVNVLQFIGFLQ